ARAAGQDPLVRHVLASLLDALPVGAEPGRGVHDGNGPCLRASGRPLAEDPRGRGRGGGHMAGPDPGGGGGPGRAGGPPDGPDSAPSWRVKYGSTKARSSTSTVSDSQTSRSAWFVP